MDKMEIFLMYRHVIQTHDVERVKGGKKYKKEEQVEKSLPPSAWWCWWSGWWVW